jgi:hypothetical protein
MEIAQYFDPKTACGKATIAVVSILVVLFVIMIVLHARSAYSSYKIARNTRRSNGGAENFTTSAKLSTMFEPVNQSPSTHSSKSLMSHLTRRSAPVHVRSSKSPIALSDFDTNINSDFSYAATDAAVGDSIITRGRAAPQPAAPRARALGRDARFDPSRADAEGQNRLGPNAFTGDRLFM